MVLDLGDLPPEQTRRIPLATWYRFRLQAEKSRTLFLLIACVQDRAQDCDQSYAQSCVEGYAKSCAAVTLRCHPAAAHWRQAAPDSPLLLAGLHYRLSLKRGRAVDPTRKKPAASALAIADPASAVESNAAAWSSRTPWTG